METVGQKYWPLLQILVEEVSDQLSVATETRSLKLQMQHKEYLGIFIEHVQETLVC